jgi:hypothetical protein
MMNLLYVEVRLDETPCENRATAKDSMKEVQTTRCCRAVTKNLEAGRKEKDTEPVVTEDGLLLHHSFAEHKGLHFWRCGGYLFG